MDYKATFGVRRDIDFYTVVVKQMGGESRTCNAGGTKRGWTFDVKHLPIPVIRDIFSLVIRGGGGWVVGFVLECILS